MRSDLSWFIGRRSSEVQGEHLPHSLILWLAVRDLVLACAKVQLRLWFGSIFQENTIRDTLVETGLFLRTHNAKFDFLVLW